MKKSFLILGLGLLSISSCKYDDGELWDAVNSLEQRVASLESSLTQINTSISSLKTIVNNLQETVFVKKIDTSNKGYVEFLFSNGTSVKISDGITPTIGDNGNWFIGSTDTGVRARGVDGKDAQSPYVGDNNNWWLDGKDLGIQAVGKNGLNAPVISLEKEEDGLYYWTSTIDGKKSWLTDTDGKKIAGTGKDAIAPVMRVDDLGYWLISYNNGVDYENVYDSNGKRVKALGEDGRDGSKGDTGANENIFNSVYRDSSTGEIVFVLNDGTVYRFAENS